MKQGKLICLEGIDFSGKSTYCRHAADFLTGLGHPVVQTHEPGGTEVADTIASFLKQNSEETILPHTELWLFFAARCQHLHHFILPHLAKGTWVISDRFVLSSYAYQGGGRRLETAHIDALASQLPPVAPDLTVIFDIPFSVAQTRAAGRSKDRIEDETADFYQRVREVYLRYANTHPADAVLINADQEPDAVKADLEKVLVRL